MMERWTRGAAAPGVAALAHTMLCDALDTMLVSNAEDAFQALVLCKTIVCGPATSQDPCMQHLLLAVCSTVMQDGKASASSVATVRSRAKK